MVYAACRFNGGFHESNMMPERDMLIVHTFGHQISRSDLSVTSVFPSSLPPFENSASPCSNILKIVPNSESQMVSNSPYSGKLYFQRNYILMWTVHSQETPIKLQIPVLVKKSAGCETILYYLSDGRWRQYTEGWSIDNKEVGFYFSQIRPSSMMQEYIYRYY